MFEPHPPPRSEESLVGYPRPDPGALGLSPKEAVGGRGERVGGRPREHRQLGRKELVAGGACPCRHRGGQAPPPWAHCGGRDGFGRGGGEEEWAPPSVAEHPVRISAHGEDSGEPYHIPRAARLPVLPIGATGRAPSPIWLCCSIGMFVVGFVLLSRMTGGGRGGDGGAPFTPSRMPQKHAQ